jgi:hypothetical protein
LHLILARLADGGPETIRDGFSLTDADLEAEYRRLRAAHPEASACCKSEPG